jgi:hypothetical protein
MKEIIQNIFDVLYPSVKIKHCLVHERYDMNDDYEFLLTTPVIDLSIDCNIDSTVDILLLENITGLEFLLNNSK